MYNVACAFDIGTASFDIPVGIVVIWFRYSCSSWPFDKKFNLDTTTCSILQPTGEAKLLAIQHL